MASTTGLWVTGDSVILGIRSKLEAKQHISLVNARVGRQAPELLAVMRVDQTSVPESPVVFNLGNNNALSEPTVVEIFEILKNQPQIIVVNTAVPRSWKDAKAHLRELIQALKELPKLKLRGIMSIPSNTKDAKQVIDEFKAMHTLYSELKNEMSSIDTLSMGMSNDFKLAIEYGSNLVRIGTAIFGVRALKTQGVDN